MRISDWSSDVCSSDLIEALARDHLKAQVPDAALRARLAPDFPIGCKRTLLSDDYYPALMRRRVDLETRAIAAIAPDGVRLADGETVPLDVLIWATRSEEHTSELQSLMRISYAVFCLK